MSLGHGVTIYAVNLNLISSKQHSASILSLGMVFKQNALDQHLAVSQAANNWRHGLYGSLKQLSERLSLIGHCPEQIWPLGQLLPGKASYLSKEFSQELSAYPNVAGLRFRWLAAAYRRMVGRYIDQYAPDYLLTYNPLPWHLPAACYAARKGVKWVSLVLDLDDPLQAGWEPYRTVTKAAAGHVFLSWWGYEQAPVAAKLHLDAGADAWMGGASPSNSERPSVLYSGLNSAGAGLDLLVETIRRIERQDVEFWVTGKGQHAGLQRLAEEDSRVRLLGYVSDARLELLTREAWVLFNPRDPLASDNRMAFPSKLLAYLSYGKPVVSTWTPGLAPEYRDLLEVVDSATPTELAVAIEACLNWNPAQRLQRFEAAREFVTGPRSWSQQATRLVEFMEQL
jgi:glycosyltransferase involved in cell wall biosynthesis